MAPVSKTKKKGELYFGIDARHIRQLGQELVGDRTTAVTELIKNAYDADATTVALKFRRAGRKGGTLEVEDNGNGMSLTDVERGWMRISTDAKNVNQRSPRYRRTRAGRKGIGRFATETLGRKLHLWTTVEGEPTALNIAFDWEADYPPGSELGDIANPFWLEPAAEDDHGTTLRIEGLYEAWDEDARAKVRKAIRLLQPPFPPPPPDAKRRRRKIDPGFSMNVEVNGQPDTLFLPGYDDFRQAGTARLHANVTASGRLTVHVTSPHLNVDEKAALKGRYEKVGAFSLDASYFVFSAKVLGGVGVQVAKTMANEFAGIRLYRDGLRVMPYGERDNDWLGLDQLSASRSLVLVPIANLNWFGQISIGRDSNPDLRDTASREGVVENEAFEQLQRAVKQALVWTATKIGEERQRKVSTSKRSGVRSRRAIVNDARKAVEQSVRKELSSAESRRLLPVVQSAFDQVSGQAGASDRSEQQQIESLVDEIELLRILASLGTSIAVFSHEVRSALTTSSGALQALTSGKRDAERLERAHAAVEELQDLAGYIDAYVSSTQRRSRDPQPLAKVIGEFKKKLSRNLARNVKFATKVTPAALRTAPMARSELESVLINLLTNSVKAMDGEGHPERQVSITAQESGAEVQLRFQDTGTGIDPKISETMFDAFVTDTRSQVSELGTGTGLGLKIVKDIVEGNGGSVAISEPDTPFTTCIEIRLPRWQPPKGGSGG